MDTIFHDVRYALRMLLRNPGFTAVAVLTLALGIGVNTAVFSVVDAVLLRPLPFPESERLMFIRETMRELPKGSVSYPNYLDWRATQRSFTDLAMLRRASLNVSYGVMADTPPERVSGATVTANFFTVLGLHPVLGRNFTAEEDTPNGPRAVLLGDGLWRRRFGANPNVIGQRINIDGVPREIVGILPPTAQFPTRSELFVPLGPLRANEDVLSRGSHPGFSVLGRLKPGMIQKQAEQDMDAIAANLEKQYPDSNTGRRVSIMPLLEYSVGDYRHSLYLLLGAVGCVLLIACANVANLQLARAVSRERELAVRAALGASRWRLGRQLLTEGALLGVIGGAAGVLLAFWALDAIVALSPANVIRFQNTKLDWNALAFTAAAALGAGVLVGAWPAWRMSRMAAMSAALREAGARGGTGGAAQQRARSLLVVGQVAMAVVLLTAAGLTLKSFWRAQNEPLGFNPAGILTMTISLPRARYDTDEKQIRFYDQLLVRVRALPGVAAAATGVNVPFDDNEWDSSIHITGTPPDAPGTEPSAEMNYISPDYFAVMGMPILRGRAFGPQEVFGTPRSVIIDESFAQRFFPGKDPLGQHIDDSFTLVKDAPPLTVIGVVRRTRNSAPGQDNFLVKFTQIHLAASQDAVAGQSLLVRVSSGDPMALAEPVRREVLGLDPDLPAADISTMEKNIAASLAPRRLTMTLLGVFAALALVLASIGLYGVMALSVTQRTRELGIRLALGAQPSSVVNMILRRGMILVGVGLGVGLAAALAVSQLLTSLLYDVGARDLSTLGIVAFVLGGSALLACWAPARRATRIDPMSALRQE